MTDYITRDSGERQEFSGGARRDISTGKTRYDLIPADALKRWGDLMGRGAVKYGESNWTLGIDTGRFYESALRHLYTYILGDRTEDHLAAVLFNVGGMMFFEGDPEWDTINGTPAVEAEADDELFEWALDVCEDETCDCSDNEERWEQLELPFDVVDKPFKSMVNWEQLRIDVEAGKVNGDQIRWPAGEAPKVSLAKKAQ